MTRGNGLLALAVAAAVLATPFPARAGFTDTVPKYAFLVDESLLFSWTAGGWDGSGHSASLIEPLDLYEPGGPKQGTLKAAPFVRTTLLVSQIYFGLADNLTVGVGIPVVLETAVDANLSWQPGDYQPRLGRAYTEADFWSWAAAMGQPRPADFRGNHGVLSDLVLGLRWRWSDHVPALRRARVGLALLVSGALPTGHAPDPENPVAVGTTLWDLNAQGDLAVHLGFDRVFPEARNRFQLGADVFYEHFFPRTRRTPKGTTNPLLLTYAPYVGDTYKVRPGDYSGFAVEFTAVPWVGPPLGTWLSGGDPKRAVAFPPLLTLTVGYRFVHLQQTVYDSPSPHWNWRRERLRSPGFRNVLTGRLTLSLLRLGAPVQVYLNYSNTSWLPGRNTPASDVLTVGLQVPLKFW